MDGDEEQTIYKDYVLGDLTIENVPFEKVVTYVLAPETFYNINKISKDNYNKGKLNKKTVEYTGKNEK